MGKVLAIIFLAVFVWYAGPILKQGLWFAPTLYPEYWWGEDVYDYTPAVASDGYGWFSFDPRETSSNRGMTTNTLLESL